MGINKCAIPYWGNKGVLIHRMGTLPSSIYIGSPFDQNGAVIIPNEPKNISNIFSYVSSDDYCRKVRILDKKVGVTPGTLTKVPFDLEHWTQVAEEKYPHGLPEPFSDDPTQWIFHGHPCGSVVWSETSKKLEIPSTKRKDETVLQVAIARLLGYHWPAETDSEMELALEQKEWVEACKTFDEFVDEDGIVAIPPVRGEERAVDRITRILARAYGEEWNTGVLETLLDSVGYGGKGLEDYLRNGFFAHHCKLFQHRPFLWQIWDGLPDGFSVLVNYHKLDSKNLETLIYTYLGDWINRQKQDKQAGIDGAEEKIAAAEILKKELESIHKGESPYDIFVRWKSLKDQPIGYNPDLNDGVRMNIRPFLKAKDIKKKDAGILRDKPNIKWDKDRGKDVESAPWYHKFGGDRINDHHTSLEEKLRARG